MAAQTGTRTTFNSTVGLKIDLSDLVPFVTTPYDTPFLDSLPKGSPSQNAVLHQWQEDTLVASTDSITNNMLIGDGTFTAGDFTIYKKGYVIKAGSELMRVSATPTSSTVSVTRAYAGTSAAAHDGSGTPITVTFVGYAVTDGADPEQFVTTNRTVSNNNIQTFQEAITVSDLEQWAQNYGVDDKYTYEVKKWLKTMRIRLENTVLYSTGSVDNTNSTRTMKGLDSFITSNVDSSATAPTEALLLAQIQACYQAGGVPDLILVGPKQKRVLTGLIAASQKWYTQGNLGGLTLGGNVTKYENDFGVFDIMLDRNIPVNNLYILQKDHIRLIEGKPFTHELLAKTGTADKGEIVGWYTLEVKGQAHMAKFTALT